MDGADEPRFSQRLGSSASEAICASVAQSFRATRSATTSIVGMAIEPKALKGSHAPPATTQGLGTQGVLPPLKVRFKASNGFKMIKMAKKASGAPRKAPTLGFSVKRKSEAGQCN